jgi:hypothetical protein
MLESTKSIIFCENNNDLALKKIISEYTDGNVFFVLLWVMEECEDIYLVLVNLNSIIDVEFLRTKDGYKLQEVSLDNIKTYLGKKAQLCSLRRKLELGLKLMRLSLNFDELYDFVKSSRPKPVNFFDIDKLLRK